MHYFESSPETLLELVRFQMVLDKLDQKLRDSFNIPIGLFCLFSKTQIAILFPL